MTDALMYTDTNGDAHVVGVMSDKAEDIKYGDTNVGAALDTLNEGNIPSLETKIDNTFRTATSNNLIPMPYKDAHGTKNGITYDQIDNAQPGDLPGYGSYKINGTASAYTELELTQTDIYLIPGTYRFQGGIGGSSSTYYLKIEVYNSKRVVEEFKNYSTYGQDWTTFTLTEKSRIKMKAIINSGVTVNNVPLFPILERFEDATALSITMIKNNGYVESITANAYKIGKLLFFSLSDMRPIQGQTPDWVQIATIGNWSSIIAGYAHIVSQNPTPSELTLRIATNGAIYIYTPNSLNGTQIFRGQILLISAN